MTRVWWRDGLALGKAARGRLAHRYPPGSKDFIAGAGFEWADLHTIDLHGAILADEPPVKPPKDRGLEFSLIARPADGGVPTIADAGWFRVPNAPAVVGAGLSTGEHFKYDLKAKFALFPTDDGVVFASPASKGIWGSPSRPWNGGARTRLSVTRRVASSQARCCRPAGRSRA